MKSELIQIGLLCGQFRMRVLQLKGGNDGLLKTLQQQFVNTEIYSVVICVLTQVIWRHCSQYSNVDGDLLGMFVDWVTHAFITKFNDIQPKVCCTYHHYHSNNDIHQVYRKYCSILAKDLATSRYKNVSEHFIRHNLYCIFGSLEG